MAIGKGSRVEFNGPDGKMLGLVYRMAGSEALIMSDGGRTLRGHPCNLRESSEALPSDHPSKKFRKGDRIEFQNPSFDGWKPGIVAKIDPFGFMQVGSDDGQSWKNVVSTKARLSTVPLPDHMARRPSSYTKGDRVEFQYNGETRYGVVSKGGSSRVQVIEDGGVFSHSGPISVFRPSTHMLKTGGPDEMDRWSVASYKLHEKMSDDTPCFEAVIALDGKKVISASNHGTGGCDDFHAFPGAPDGVVERFESESRAWVARFDTRADDSRFFECSSSWLDWEVNKKPYGVTASDFFEESNRLFEEAVSQPLKPR